jgi:hypothetical protein
VHDGVQLRPRGVVVEHEVADLLPVERAVIAQNVGSELRDDGGEGRLAGLDDPAGEVVGVDVHRAVLDQSPGDGGLS